jgi:hypothetical protein
MLTIKTKPAKAVHGPRERRIAGSDTASLAPFAHSNKQVDETVVRARHRAACAPDGAHLSLRKALKILALAAPPVAAVSFERAALPKLEARP